MGNYTKKVKVCFKRLTCTSYLEIRTIARSFSQELMDIFKIENSIADLGDQVDKRYVAE